ncbi:MAG: tetratricopeptide repeat protein [Myxococcales bacterium]|nr:MAG: tetratricopeptide repeat protein [Myxococcales bacterium]
MSSRDSDGAPERLLHGKYGPLLRQANREWESGLDESAAFRRVAERLAASRAERFASRMRWLVSGAPFAVAALVAVILLSRRQGAEGAPELVAETWRPAASASQQPSAGTAVAPPAQEPSLSRPERKKEPRAGKRSGPAAVTSAPASAPQAPPSPTPPVEPALAEPLVANGAASTGSEAPHPPDCLSLARQGQTRAAEGCFLERAQGGGLAAEMALYELARLRRDVLADANGALQALADYRTRFPAGSLRREVDMSQLELLLQLGRSDDALRQSDQLLSSSTSGERASELRLLRGHILRKQSRFAEAAREFELAEGGGARRGDAVYFRALCLEAAGRPTEAAAALSKYLEQPHRPYAEDAKRRLEKLKP